VDCSHLSPHLSALCPRVAPQLISGTSELETVEIVCDGCGRQCSGKMRCADKV
jgi:hypothetical protein